MPDFKLAVFFLLENTLKGKAFSVASTGRGDFPAPIFRGSELHVLPKEYIYASTLSMCARSQGELPGKQHIFCHKMFE